MAVTSVKEIFAGRRGGDNLDRKRDYVRVFEVQTSDPDDDPTVAGGTSLLPRNGEPHPSDAYAVMVDIDADQSSESPYLWQVTCRYSSDLGQPSQQREALAYDPFGAPGENPGYTTSSGGGQVTRDPDPRNRPAVFEVDWEQTTEVLMWDVNGDPIVNSAGDRFDPPPTVERSYPVITITKNLDVSSELLNLDNQQVYQEIVNSDTPWGFPAGSLRFARWRHSSAFENDVAYAVLSVTIKVKWDGWKLRLLDVGFRNAAGAWFVDPDTRATPADPRPLDGAGNEQAVGTAAAELEFDIYREAEFVPILAIMGVTA